MANFESKTNYAVGRIYHAKIKKLIKKYYQYISNASIEEFLKSGNLSDLIAKDILMRSGLYYETAIEPELDQICAEFVNAINSYSNAQFNRAFRQAKKPMPPISFNDEIKRSLISQQVNKISNICDYQKNKISDVLHNQVIQDVSLTRFKELLQEAGISDDKRIKTVAFNQLHYVTNVVDAQKATNLGINSAIWKHIKNMSVYRTHPRKSHVDADGSIFDLDKGCKIDGEYILPGQLENCRCSFVFNI